MITFVIYINNKEGIKRKKGQKEGSQEMKKEKEYNKGKNGEKVSCSYFIKQVYTYIFTVSSENG